MVGYEGVKRVLGRLRSVGPAGMISPFYRKLRRAGVLPAIRLVVKFVLDGSALPGFESIESNFAGKVGLEIGGPSTMFVAGSLLPVYGLAKRVDNCNFAKDTIWGPVSEKSFAYARSGVKLGTQFICEGTRLSICEDRSYDFVLSCHTLEHIANPLRALLEWKRVLRDGGVLLLCLPDKERTFDRHRSVSTLEHLIADYEKDVGEDDLTHLREVLDMHDLSVDPECGSFEEFAKRSAKNVDNRCIHHHVFDTDLVARMIDHVGFSNLLLTSQPPYHIIALCQKLVSAVRD